MRRKYHRPVPIADTEQEWGQIEHLILDHVIAICGGNPKRATSLLNLLFILTDEDFDETDRGMVAESAIRAAFGFSGVALHSLKEHFETLRTPKGRVADIKAVSA